MCSFHTHIARAWLVICAAVERHARRHWTKDASHVLCAPLYARLVQPVQVLEFRLADWWQHSKLALNDQGNMLAGSHVNSLGAYSNNFFVYVCQLEHRTDGDERFLSGIDTRGAAAQCYFKASGAATAAATTTVFAECTSSLRIFSNKVLEVVQ